MKKSLAFLLCLFSCMSPAQVQLGGHVYVPSTTDSTLGQTSVVIATDANCTTLTATNCTVSGGSSGPWVGTMVVTSSVSLTATRNVVVPLSPGRSYMSCNATTGTQAMQVIGSTGTGATVPNGWCSYVYSDGTNYYSSQAMTALNVGGGNFVVNASGNFTTINGIPASWPSANPTSGTSYLTLTSAGQVGFVSGVSPGCGGVSCVLGNQTNVQWTTSSQLLLGAAMTSSQTTATFTSTTGFPAVGCFYIQLVMAGGGNEAMCYTSVLNSTQVGGLTRGLFGTTATAHNSGDSGDGYIQLTGYSLTTTPLQITLNTGLTVYNAATTGIGQQVQFNGSVSLGSGANFGGTMICVQGTFQGTYSSGSPSYNLSCLTGRVTGYNKYVANGMGQPYTPAAPTKQTGLTSTTTGNLQCALITAPGTNVTCPAGMYQIKIYATVTAAGTAGTLTLSCGWNDGNAQSLAATPVSLTTVGAGGYAMLDCPAVDSAGSANLTYAATLTGATGSPAYSLDVVLAQWK